MPDFHTLIQTVSGLLAYHPGDDAAASATARDASPNNLPLTKNAGGTLGGAAFVNGIAGCGHIDGSSASSFSRVVVSGSALDPTSALTIGMWVKVTTLPASGTPQFMGRSTANYAVNMLATGAIRAAIASVPLPGGQVATVQSPFGVAVGETNLIAVAYSSRGDVALSINGVVVATINRPGAIVASAGGMGIGGSLSLAFDWAGHFVVNRALGASELRDLYLAGVSAPVSTYFIPGDRPGGAATPSIDGGHADPANDAMVGAARADQHGAQRGDVPHVWPSLTDHATTVPREAAKLIAEQVISYTHRAHPSDPIYHDGTKFRWSGSSATFDRSTVGIVSGLAALHRFCGLSKRSSWPLEFAKKHGDWLITQQDPVTGRWFPAVPSDPTTWFVLHHMAMATYVLKDQLDAPRLAAWTAAIEAAATYITTGPDAPWYVNGNIELQAALGIYLVYKVTGKASWLATFETQWAKTLYPTAALNNSTGAGQSSALYGLRSNTGASGTVNGAAIGSDAALLALSDTAGQCYLAESTNPGTIARDIDYLQVQIAFAARLYLVSGDARARKLLNVLVNTAITKLQLLAAPVSNVPTTAATGGSLAAATYFTKVVALVGGGESPVSAEQSIATTGAVSTITQTWAAVTGATGYRVYVGTATGAQDRYIETAAVTTLTITTLAAAVVKAPPTVNTALNWVLDATSGSRHNLLTGWLTGALEVLVWKGLRPDLAIYDLGSHWSNKLQTDFRSAQSSSAWTNENYWIGIGDWLAQLLTASNAWPGFPA